MRFSNNHGRALESTHSVIIGNFFLFFLNTHPVSLQAFLMSVFLACRVSVQSGAPSDGFLLHSTTHYGAIALCPQFLPPLTSSDSLPSSVSVQFVKPLEVMFSRLSASVQYLLLRKGRVLLRSDTHSAVFHVLARLLYLS